MTSKNPSSANSANVEGSGGAIDSPEDAISSSSKGSFEFPTSVKILSNPSATMESPGQELVKFRFPPLNIKNSSTSAGPEDETPETHSSNELEEPQTPKGPEFMIPKMLTCPPAPKVPTCSSAPEPPRRRKVKSRRATIRKSEWRFKSAVQDRINRRKSWNQGTFPSLSRD